MTNYGHELLETGKTSFKDIKTGEFITMEYIGNNKVYVAIVDKCVPSLVAITSAYLQTIEGMNTNEQITEYTPYHPQKIKGCNSKSNLL